MQNVSTKLSRQGPLLIAKPNLRSGIMNTTFCYLLGVTDTICAVSRSEYLSYSGWIILKNKFDGDVPFRLYHENDKTFLQWLGDDDSRAKMQGRLVLVHLSCRSVKQNSTLTKTEGTLNLFSESQ